MSVMVSMRRSEGGHQESVLAFHVTRAGPVSAIDFMLINFAPSHFTIRVLCLETHPIPSRIHVGPGNGTRRKSGLPDSLPTCRVTSHPKIIFYWLKNNDF